METLINELQSIGLPANEAKVLVCLFQHGLLSAKSLSELLGVPKISVLYATKSLESKNLIEKRKRYSTFIFQTKSPERIKEYLELEKLRIDGKIEQSVPLIEKLKKLQNYESGKTITYYDDPKEILRIRSSLLDSVQTTWKMKRAYDEETKIEQFEGENVLYIFSDDHSVCLKVEPKTNMNEIINLFSKIKRDD